MAVVSRGFHGRPHGERTDLPPGQYLTQGFPVLSAGPTPTVRTGDWQFTITTETGGRHIWNWRQFRALAAERFTVDLHCVTRWSKLRADFEGVPLDTLFENVDTTADFALVHSYGGYTTNLPLADLLGGQAWLAFRFDGAELAAEHGGPARLLVPHLYLWKSAKWISGITLSHQDQPGFWEGLGYHDYGDPWREQRYWGD